MIHKNIKQLQIGLAKLTAAWTAIGDKTVALRGRLKDGQKAKAGRLGEKTWKTLSATTNVCRQSFSHCCTDEEKDGQLRASRVLTPWSWASPLGIASRSQGHQKSYLVFLLLLELLRNFPAAFCLRLNFLHPQRTYYMALCCSKIFHCCKKWKPSVPWKEGVSVRIFLV